MASEICVESPCGLAPHATYEAPMESATGVGLVFINGVITWRDASR